MSTYVIVMRVCDSCGEQTTTASRPVPTMYEEFCPGCSAEDAVDQVVEELLERLGFYDDVESV